MRRAFRWLLLLGGWLGFTNAVEAFVGDVNAAGQYRRWALNPTDGRVPATSVNARTRAIIYHLDAAGWSAAGASNELDAVRCAFDQWQGVAGSVLKFEEGALVSGTVDVNRTNGLNTLFWSTNLIVNGGRDNLFGVLALTYVASFAEGNVITDADTVFNGVSFSWFTDHADSTTSKAFVEAIALHEIGHFLGLRHSPVGGATMLAVGDLGVNSQVGLSSDELAAVRALYGTAPTLAAGGRITGKVASGGIVVPGAAVFAENASGVLVAGTVARTNGVYELPGMPPGQYKVRVAPLDPLSAANYLVRGVDIASAYQAAPTEFQPTADRALTLAPGGAATIDFEVVSGSPMRLVRLLRPTNTLAQASFNNKPVYLPADGATRYVGALTPASVGAGAVLSLSGPGLSVGTTEVRANALGALTLVAAPVTVARGTAPGLRDLRVQNGDAFAWVHGFVEIPPDVPDLNADGLDDRFQRAYWTRFTRPEAAPTADPDQDGFDNRWEFQRGSNPTNALSANFNVVSVRLAVDGARVVSETAAGKRFQLFARDTLPGSEWVAVGAAVTAKGSTTEFVDTTASRTVRFYRVRLAP